MKYLYSILYFIRVKKKKRKIDKKKNVPESQCYFLCITVQFYHKKIYFAKLFVVTLPLARITLLYNGENRNSIVWIYFAGTRIRYKRDGWTY